MGFSVVLVLASQGIRKGYIFDQVFTTQLLQGQRVPAFLFSQSVQGGYGYLIEGTALSRPRIENPLHFRMLQTPEVDFYHIVN